MNFKPLLKCWVLLVIVCLTWSCAPEPKPNPLNVSKEVMAELNEANFHFTYRGKPIAPKAVNDLTAWDSDQFPGPVAVDLEANDSNRYSGDVERNANWFMTRWQDEESKSSFGYQYVGRLANGFHVLHTAKNDGGSGTFESLLLVKFSAEGAYAEDKAGIKIGYRVVLHQVGELALGDRSGAELKVKGSSVFVAKAGMPVREIRF